MTSASHASRRAVPGDSSVPSSVTGDQSILPLQGVEGEGDRDPGAGAVGVGGQVGAQRVLAGLHHRVPHPGAVVAHVLPVPTLHVPVGA